MNTNRLHVKPCQVNATKYGERKARRHAQDEANRIGRRVYMQFDPLRTLGTVATFTIDHLPLPGIPWETFYPETPQQKQPT